MFPTFFTVRFVLAAGAFLIFWALWSPVHSGIHQGMLCVGIAMICIGGYRGLRKYPRSRRIMLFAIFVSVIPFLLPGREMDVGSLRSNHIVELRRFEETRYVWGGESGRGIDCSGLPRRALRNALWWEGMRTANGNAFRLWLDLWFFDSSAKAMGEGYRGRTLATVHGGPLWALNPQDLLPGDLAIRSDGVHVVVYLGNNEWIEADPQQSKVRRWIPKPTDGPWYEPMTIHRWSVLAPK
jgi:NlpC/P60 family